MGKGYRLRLTPGTSRKANIEEVKMVEAARAILTESEQGKCTETHTDPSIDRVSRVHFDLRLSLELSLSWEVVGGGRYWTRTSDLVRVKHAL